MKVAITGATGFIGKLLVSKHIKLGNEVRILSRKENLDLENFDKVQVFKGDLNDKETLLSFVDNVDVVYHCAAEIKDESLMSVTNVEGTKNLIDVSKHKIKHWIQLSSTGVYGPVRTGTVKEDQPYSPVNEYERTKLISDELVIEAGEKEFFTYTLVRPSNVFGFQMTNQSIFQLVKSIDKGLYFFIGSKGSSANYVPVENVIEVLYLTAINPASKNQIYIISSWITIENFISTIAKTLNKNAPKLRVPIEFVKFLARLTSFIPKNPLTVTRVDALSNRAIYDTSKVEKELNYKPVVTIEETIVKVVDFVKNNKKHL
ncbi:NAD-dependent epimerase/dehydratase family protein [Flavobacterium oncorhynchi]|uniref:NAD-dependent epimerase/dehydratase family protein n=1 Tax=Flavobacterium oncorhynchi TaxID=728056 RepID=UPI00351A7658